MTNTVANTHCISTLYFLLCCHHQHHHDQRHPHTVFTHIYPLKVAVGLRWGNHSIICVDDGNYVHAQKLLQCAVQVLPLLVIVEIQICHKDLTEDGVEGRDLRKAS